MVAILALCSLLLGLGSLLTWLEARAERKARLQAGSAGEHRGISRLLRAGFAREDIASGFLVTGKNGGQAELDLVVRVGDAAVVVETKNWSGVVEGGRKDREWSAVKRDGTCVNHRNPLSQASRQARFLWESTGQGAVGIVLMAGSAKHSSGTFPDGVTGMEDLPVAVRAAVASMPAKQRGKHAWDKISTMASRPEAAAEAKAYGAFLDSIIGRKPWLSWLAMGAVTAAAAIFIEDNTAYSLEKAVAHALSRIGLQI